MHLVMVTLCVFRAWAPFNFDTKVGVIEGVIKFDGGSTIKLGAYDIDHYNILKICSSL